MNKFNKAFALPNEVWSPVKGYEGLYKVSTMGNAKSLNYNKTGKEKVMKLTKDPKGYLRLHLSKDGKVKTFQVHRLVAQAFIPNPDNLPCINHKDENPLNNHYSNLEFCSYQYNNTYGRRIERVTKAMTNGKLSKPVCQYSLDGEFIKEWPSLKEVQRQLGFNKGNLSACCRGKYKQAYGYIWRYK